MVGPVAPPVGTVALLFTDMERSTHLARELGSGWAEVKDRHVQIIGEAVAARGGWVDSDLGDEVLATFDSASEAAHAAIDAQRALRSEVWPAGVGQLRVRMGLHVGWVERTSKGYVGLEVHRASRVMSAAHGGQVVLSAAARNLLADSVQVDDLGLHRLKDFPAPEHLFCAVIDGRGAAEFPPLRTLDLRPSNLPPDRPKLIGRDADVKDLVAALADTECRLITITGRGGVGKTSVGLVVGAELLGSFEGGVWWVSLASVPAAADVLGRIAGAVHSDPAGRASVQDALVARLAGPPVLLILDNMEHLLAASTAIGALLVEIPNLKVLVTSQAPLAITGEHLHRLDALAEQAAMELLTDRGETARPGLVLSEADLHALREVGRRLDHLPLALELAAARLSVLSPVQLETRIAESPDFLHGGARDSLERHRSLRAITDWTLSLLELGPRSIFTLMGLFARAASLEDIAAVAGRDEIEVMDSVTSLLDLALVRRVEEGDSVLRFELPEALHQIALAQLDRTPDAESARRAHAERVVAVLRPARLVMQASAGVYPAARRLDPDASQAWVWATDHDPRLAQELAAFWSVRLAVEGHFREMDALLPNVLDDESAPPALRATALFASAMACRSRMQIAEAFTFFASSLALAEQSDSDLVPVVLATRGKLHAYLGHFDEGVADCARASELARRVNRPCWAGALVAEAQVLMQAGRLDAAERLHRLATDLCEAEPAWAADPLLSQQGDLAAAGGRPLEALEYYVRCVALSESLRDDLQLVNDFCDVFHCLVLAGHPIKAMEILGLAHAHATQAFGTPEWVEIRVSASEITDARSAEGPDAADGAYRRGTACLPGERAATAIRLITQVLRAPIART